MMMRLYTVFMVVSMATGGAYATDNVIQMPNPCAENPKPVDEWFRSLDHAKVTRTKLHFYIQDVLGGDSPTVFKVAESAITATSATTFGLINMMDDLLTAGPEPESEVVGRAQGTVGFADLHSTALQMGMNIVFTDGKYNGSTISILGRNPVAEKERELPIVGGTGVFRMAGGVAVGSTYSFDADTNYGVLEYTLYITYYSL